jgi:hypothetical protein
VGVGVDPLLLGTLSAVKPLEGEGVVSGFFVGKGRSKRQDESRVAVSNNSAVPVRSDRLFIIKTSLWL